MKEYAKDYSERFKSQSVWLTTTPTALSLALPFYVTEAGHFYAEQDYLVERNAHDSFLLLYTLKGCGMVQSRDIIMQLPEKTAVYINCHDFHKYCAVSDDWEFLWAHIKGNTAEAFYHMLYPNDIFCIDMNKLPKETFMQEQLFLLMEQMQKNDIISSTSLSVTVHMVLNALIECSLAREHGKKKLLHTDAVEHVISFVHTHYAENISIDDMLQGIPVSKYHFIRSFKRTMGITPYHYLTNYRITQAKTLLRSDERTVGEIAEACGFADTSNFIVQFRKYTGQNPLQYRKYFGGY